MHDSAPGRAPARIVFISREPIIHQQGGSTTYALGLLELLRAQGAEITLVGTLAFGRSPRPFFRQCAKVPEGVRVHFPGYWRLGTWWIRPFSVKSWARYAARAANQRKLTRPVCEFLERLYRGGLFTGAWDLTEPTEAEAEVAIREVQAAKATSVVANYCIWGPVLQHTSLAAQRTAILMHDLLWARTARFQASGLELDSPVFRQDQEMSWLSAADTVLAAQEREAEEIRPRVNAKVVVTPVMLHPRRMGEERIEAGRCLFVGSNILPNITGLEFLLSEVWPRVRAAVPGATLAVAGTVSNLLPANARANGILKLGLVPTLEDQYARAEVCLVPLLLGSGIKIKLLEALEFGKAVVSTPVGVQGLEAWAPEAVEVAESGAEFADAIIRLLRDAELRQKREEEALRLTEVHFGSRRELPAQFVEALL